MSRPSCFFAQFSNRACDGPLIRAHLISQQALRRRGHDVWDERVWVWACGGWTGLEGCHGRFDGFKLVVPPDRLPPELVEFAVEANMVPYIERRFGYQREAADAAQPA